MKSYIADQLNSNEELLFQCRKHWMSLLPAFISALAALVLLANTSNFSGLVSEYPVAVKSVEITVYVIALVLFWRTAKDVLIFLTTELAFTDRRLIGKVGIIRTRSLLTPLDKINHISALNGIFGRFLGFGNVLVHTSSGQITYEQIVNHSEFIKALMDQIAVWHQESQGGHGPASGPAASGVASVQPDDREPQPPRPPAPPRREAAHAASPQVQPTDSPPVQRSGVAPPPVLRSPRTESPESVGTPAKAPAPPSAPTVQAGPASEAGGDGGFTSPMLIAKCSNCQAPFSYQTSQAGKSFKCSKCGAPVIVPSSRSAPI
jgi:membrane protein YdbS with pleckstrin-like domain/DNA-directed RNA polymerase subunit RPC12/RpoP